jgi:hypothetical protein
MHVCLELFPSTRASQTFVIGEYGDSRITQPTKKEEQNLLAVKGGQNQTILIGEVDIHGLREFQIKKYDLQKNGNFKPTPPGIDVEIVKKKLRHEPL